MESPSVEKFPFPELHVENIVEVLSTVLSVFEEKIPEVRKCPIWNPDRSFFRVNYRPHNNFVFVIKISLLLCIFSQTLFSLFSIRILYGEVVGCFNLRNLPSSLVIVGTVL